MRSLRQVLAVVAVMLTSALVVAPAQAAQRFEPDGVLFYPSVGGLMLSLEAPHFCSASVVHSPSRDMVITAAHCLYGSGPTIEFVPGFRDGQAPDGVWPVTKIYVDPAWKSGQSPEADVAFLRIAPLHGQRIEDVVGSRPLGSPRVGARVTVSGFPMSSDTAAVCVDSLQLTEGYPSVRCSGEMTDGVSGGAWVQGGRVVGVIGGLQQGGCSAQVAYSAPFGAVTRRLFARATAGGPGDQVLPGFLANSCS